MNKEESKSLHLSFLFGVFTFAVLSIILAIYGLVGGETYAVRGTAWICAGIVSAVLSVTCAILANNFKSPN